MAILRSKKLCTFTNEMNRWGVEREFTKELGKTFLFCSLALNDTDFIACSSHQTFLFSRYRIKFSIPVAYSAITYSPDLDIVFGVTIGIPCIHMFRPSIPTKPILKDFALGQTLIHQVLYIHSSQLLMTVGSEIKVWKVEKSKFNVGPLFSITNLSTIPSTTFCKGMNGVFVDENRNRILVPSHEGYLLYSFEGALISQVPNLSSFPFTSVAVTMASKRSMVKERNLSKPLLFPFKRFFATDVSGHVRIWHSSGQLLKNYPVSSGTIIFSSYINSEFIIIIDLNGNIRILDAKTGKDSNSTLKQKPDRIYYFATPKPTLLVLHSNKFSVYRINLLWKLKFRPIQRPMFIDRFTSAYYSSRIGILSDEGTFTLISANKGLLVGSAASATCDKPIDYQYNRYYDESIIYLQLENNVIQKYKFEKTDFVFKKDLPFKARKILLVNTSSWIMCVLGMYCDLTIVDINDYTPQHVINLGKYQAVYGFWYQEQNCLVIITTNTLKIFDFSTMTFTYESDFLCPKIASFDNSVLMVSYEKGPIVRYTVDLDKITQTTIAKYTRDVISIGIRYHCHAIVFEDQTIGVGDDTKLISTTLELPFEVYAANFLNANLDLLVGDDHNLMIISKEEHFPDLTPVVIDPNEEDGTKLDPFIQERPKKSDYEYYIIDNSDLEYKENVEDVLREIREKMRLRQRREEALKIEMEERTAEPLPPMFPYPKILIKEREEKKVDDHKVHILQGIYEAPMKDDYDFENEVNNQFYKKESMLHMESFDTLFSSTRVKRKRRHRRHDLPDNPTEQDYQRFFARKLKREAKACKLKKNPSIEEFRKSKPVIDLERIYHCPSMTDLNLDELSISSDEETTNDEIQIDAEPVFIPIVQAKTGYQDEYEEDAEESKRKRKLQRFKSIVSNDSVSLKSKKDEKKIVKEPKSKKGKKTPRKGLFDRSVKAAPKKNVVTQPSTFKRAQSARRINPDKSHMITVPPVVMTTDLVESPSQYFETRHFNSEESDTDFDYNEDERKYKYRRPLITPSALAICNVRWRWQLLQLNPDELKNRAPACQQPSLTKPSTDSIRRSRLTIRKYQIQTEVDQYVERSRIFRSRPFLPID